MNHITRAVWLVSVFLLGSGFMWALSLVEVPKREIKEVKKATEKPGCPKCGSEKWGQIRKVVRCRPTVEVDGVLMENVHELHEIHFRCGSCGHGIFHHAQHVLMDSPAETELCSSDDIRWWAK